MSLQPDETRRSLPLAVLIEASGDFVECDECEDPEGCEEEGRCELGFADAAAKIDLLAESVAE
jgi:hypothetical protein